MIQFHSHALIVCHDNGRMEPLDVHGLVELLAASSQSAVSSLDPWVFEKVIESVVHHFREDLHRDQVPLVEFVEWIQTLLDGYSKEAGTDDKDGVVGKLDLFETVRRYGTGFELEFFLDIRHFLVEKSKRTSHEKVSLPEMIDEGKRRSLQITGLRQCAKFLSGRQRWSKRCAETRDEIVAYIREEMAHTGVQNLALIVLS